MRLSTRHIDLELPDTQRGRAWQAELASQSQDIPLSIRVTDEVSQAVATTDCGSVYLSSDALIVALWTSARRRALADRLSRCSCRATVRRALANHLSVYSASSV